MGCNCGKPKCNGKCGCKSPAVLQINNPAEYITFHKVVIPASLGDSKTYPPRNGMYRNVLAFYEADQTSWLYSTDGIPTNITGATGPVGPKGPSGTMEVGTTTTGEAGTQASVENVGTPENAILNFTIPKGDQGIQGEPGPQGYMNEQDVRDVVDTIIPEDFFAEESAVSECGTEFDMDNVLGGPVASLRMNGDSSQQSYIGKNLFSSQSSSSQSGVTLTANSDGTYTLNGVATANVNFTKYIDLSEALISQGDQLSFSATKPLPQGVEVRYEAYNGTTWLRHIVPQLLSTRQTSTVSSANLSNATRIRQNIYVANGKDSSVTNLGIQLEKSASVTSFEPFVGGSPSPSPDFPQQIKAVAGTQTITINGTDYYINLGSNKLYEFQDFQDYIWKDGDDWKIHKEFGENTDDVLVNGIDADLNSDPSTASVAGTFVIFNSNLEGADSAVLSSNLGVFKLDENLTGNAAANAMENGTFCQRQGTNDRIYFRNTALIGKTGNEVKTIMSTNSGGANVCFTLQSSIDTVITDSTLIAQLEAVRLASGQNRITVSSLNLPAEVCVEGFKNNWNGALSNIDEKIDELRSERKGMWGISRGQYGYGSANSDNSHYLLYSDDGITWQYVGKKIDKLTSDASAVCEINGYYYYVGNNSYQYSTDMVNWTNSQKIIDESTHAKWAAWFYYDELNEDIYCYMSRQDPIDPDSTATNHKIIYLVGKQNQDGTIDFENSFHELLASEDESYIDPSVIYDPVWGYIFACKVNGTNLPDEVSGTVRIYEMSDPTTIGERKLTLSGSGTEAPQLITDGQGNISVYVQDYSFLNSMNDKLGTSIGKIIPSNSCVIKLSDKHAFTTDKTNARILLKDPMSVRHIGVSYCSAKAYSLLKKIGIKPVTPMSNQHMVDNVGLTYLDLDVEGGTYYIANHPNAVYIAGSPNSLRNITLIPVCAYDHEPFKIMLTKVKITWGGDFLPSWYGEKTLENTDTIFNYIEFMPLTSGTVRPPFNGTVE